MTNKKMVRPTGLEPVTLGLEGRCSIRMSYGRIVCVYSKSGKGLNFIIGRGREIRTPDPLVPNQMRYQTALYPDIPKSRCPRRRRNNTPMRLLSQTLFDFFAVNYAT
jgi:hypothetical protein